MNNMCFGNNQNPVSSNGDTINLGINNMVTGKYNHQKSY